MRFKHFSHVRHVFVVANSQRFRLPSHVDHFFVVAFLVVFVDNFQRPLRVVVDVNRTPNTGVGTTPQRLCVGARVTGRAGGVVECDTRRGHQWVVVGVLLGEGVLLLALIGIALLGLLFAASSSHLGVVRVLVVQQKGEWIGGGFRSGKTGTRKRVTPSLGVEQLPPTKSYAENPHTVLLARVRVKAGIPVNALYQV